MAATSSSPTHPAVDHLADAVEHHRVGPGLLTVLTTVRDPRKPRGVRHPITTILALSVCAVLAGARSFTAIGDWVSDASEQVRAALGLDQNMPSESCIRRTLQCLNGD